MNYRDMMKVIRLHQEQSTVCIIKGTDEKSISFPFQNFKPIFSHYNYSSMELNGTGFSQAFPFNFHFIPQTIPRIFPYSSHSFPLHFPGSSLTIFSFSFLALFSFLSRQLGTLTSLYEIEREPFHFHFFLQTFLLGIRRG